MFNPEFSLSFGLWEEFKRPSWCDYVELRLELRMYIMTPYVDQSFLNSFHQAEIDKFCLFLFRFIICILETNPLSFEVN